MQSFAAVNLKWLDPEVPDVFLQQGNLSCSNCHINWFCLSELDLQHFQDVNFSLWLRCTQVWLSIRAACFVLLLQLICISIRRLPVREHRWEMERVWEVFYLYYKCKKVSHHFSWGCRFAAAVLGTSMPWQLVSAAAASIRECEIKLREPGFSTL